MKRTETRLIFVSLAALAMCLGVCAIARGLEAPASAALPTLTSGQPLTVNVQNQSQSEAEKHRTEAELQAQTTVDKEAAAAIEETRKAAKAIADGKEDEALAAIERATGKIAILIARKPEIAFVPVNVEVTTIDTAPQDANAVDKIVKSAEKALEDKDYPLTRVLLEGLTSEVRIRTYHLPLATYPLAMREAARLLDQKKAKEASTVLATALNTLVAIDRGIPLPLVRAQTEINEAQAKRESDKSQAQTLLAGARADLERARLLGYAGKDPEYSALAQSISELEKQLQGSSSTTSAFSKLKDKMDAFFKKLSEAVKKV